MNSKQKILINAIDLIQESGFEKVTLREVCRRSDQNLATVSYHYGGKDGLFNAIIDGYYVDLSKQWEKLFNTLQNAYGDHIQPKYLIRAYLDPFVHTNYSGFSRKLGRTMFTRLLMQGEVETLHNLPAVKKIIYHFVEALRRSIPSLSEAEALRVFRLSAGAAVTYISTESYNGTLTALDPEADPMVDIEFDFVCSYCSAFTEKMLTEAAAKTA